MMANNSMHMNVYWIKPLKGAKNYTVWKIKMTDILTDQGLWEYASRVSALPTDMVQQVDWHKKDQTALSTIWLPVANQMLVYVASTVMSKDVWDMLKSLLKPQGALGIVLVWQKLFQTQCEEGTSIEEQTLCSYQEELNSLREKLDRSEFSVILLTSLLESWNGYILSINTMAFTNMPKVIAHILEHS
jgi:hypothetical protein